MTNALPGKREFWGNLVQSVKAIFAPPIYMADKNAETQRLKTEWIMTERTTIEEIEEIEERIDERRDLHSQMKQAEMQLQVLQQEKNLAFPAEQEELNRQLQGELARLNDFLAEQEELKRQWQSDYRSSPVRQILNLQLQEELARLTRDFQAKWEVGILNLQLQGELARLNREFQANEGKLNRQHALQIELFRENLQQFLFAQQKHLQLELKQLDAKLYQVLRKNDRESHHKTDNSPLWLFYRDLINADLEPITLLVFLSPPALPHDRSEGGTRGFPEMEQFLGKSLRSFFEKYTQNGRPIWFLAGAWRSKGFHSEAATHAIFRDLKGEPVLILESAVEGGDFNLNLGYWGVSWANYRYKTAISFPWQEVLYEFAKMRTWRWKQKRDDYIAAGKDQRKFDKRYGQESVAGFMKNL